MATRNGQVRPPRTYRALLCALAGACPLVALNVHIGFTVYATRALMGLFAASSLLSALARRGRVRVAPLDPRFALLFAGLLLIQAVSSLNAQSAADGLRKMSIYLFLMLLFIVVQATVFSTRDAMSALWVFTGMGAFEGLFGLYQVVGFALGWPMLLQWLSFIPSGNSKHRLAAIVGEDGVPRAFGTVTEPNNYAAFMVVVLMCLIAWMLERGITTRRKRRLLLITLVLTAVGLVLANSRSGVATLLVGCLALTVLAHRRGVLRASRLLRVVLPATLILPVVLGGVIAAGTFRTRMGFEANVLQSLAYRMSLLVHSDDPYSQQSVAGHVTTRLLGLEIFSQHPVLGIGPGNFAGYYSDALRTRNLGSHSHHIDILAETGIVGAATEWLIMALAALVMFRGLMAAPRHSSESIWLLGLLSGFVATLAGNLLYHFYLNDFVWFAMASGVTLAQRVLEGRTSPWSQ